MSGLRRVLRRLAGEGGLTLPELITTMAILAIVMTGVTALFVSGSKAQSDLTARFDAQTELRDGLDKLRRDVHQACSATNVSASSVTLALPDPANPGPCSLNVTWCTQLDGSTYSLYKASGAACTGGTRYAQYLTSASVFTYYPQNTDGSGGGSGTYALARLHVALTADADGHLSGGTYGVVDDIAFRNSART